MADWKPEDAARWIAEAVETGNPLGALPAGVAPRDLAEAEAVAVAVLAKLEIVPCGLRLLRRPGLPSLAGPMIEGRLVPGGATIACAALRHPTASAAVVGVLAAALDPDETTPPTFTRLHAAIDVAASRYAQASEDDLALTADLAGLGLVVTGKGRAAPAGMGKVMLGAKGSTSRGVATDLAAAFAEAAVAARAWGGLPAGALLVVAGLTPPVPAEGELAARLTGLGTASAVFAP